MPRSFLIGRDRASDIAIADDSVSRTHAEIWLEANGALMIADRGSSNGTELIRDGQASTISQTPLLAGDQVRFGAITLSVKDLVDAIECKHPGALTGSAPKPPAGPPPLPIGASPAVPPPPPLPQPTPHFPEAGLPFAQAPLPPPPMRAVAQQSGTNIPGPLVRCECGAIKSLGQICPGCHR